MGIRRCLQTCLVGSFGLAVFGLLGGGCSDAPEQKSTEAVTGKPHLLALSTYSASLGTPVDAYLSNPPPATATKFELVFDGTYKRADGREEKVAITQPTQRTEAGAVRWTSFGPFTNPFAEKDPDIGTFEGKVAIKVTLEDGTETLDESPLPVKFDVQPSILITEMQPVEADCGKPALRLIGQMSYKMKATTIGFKAASITYQIKIPGTFPDVSGRPVLDVDSTGTPQYRTTQLVIDPTVPAATEDKKAFSLPPVPEDLPSYGVVFGVIAKDANGKQIASSFGMRAHRPIDLFYDGSFQLAQVYPAKPVSSCIPGAQQGRQVDYSEAQAETRQRALSITLSKNWMKGEENNWSTQDGKIVTKSLTETEGYSNSTSKSNTFSFERNGSDTTGVAFTASTSNTFGVNAKVPIKIFEVGGNYERSSSNATTNSSSSTRGWSEGKSNTTTETAEKNASTATTDSTAVTKTDTKGGSRSDSTGGAQDASDSWTVASSDTIQKGFSGSVIAGTYGVFYRQLARYTQRAFVMVYNMCGEGSVIGDVTQQDYIWAPDLALSNSCSQLPKSNFPEPQCYLPPCDPQ